MKTGIIADVNGIANDKEGKPINVIAIRLTNGQVILRGLNQFKTDLANSNRLLGVNLDAITSVLHPAIQNELPRLKNGGNCTGEWRMVKAGETYEVTAPNDPDYGKTKEYTKDHIRTDGFLSLEPSSKYLNAELTAKETAMLHAQLNGMFAATNVSATADAAAEEEIPEELLEAVGAGVEVEEEAETTGK